MIYNYSRCSIRYNLFSLLLLPFGIKSATIFNHVKNFNVPHTYEEREVNTIFSRQPNFFFEGHPISRSPAVICPAVPPVRLQ